MALSVSRPNVQRRLNMKKVNGKGFYPSFLMDDELLKKIKDIIEKRPTYGYRQVTVLLNNALCLLGKNKGNHKRVYRIMKAHQ